MKYDEKVTLSIDSSGNVLKCAKGAVADCGFVTGAELCAKCGAMPVEMKMVPAVAEPEADEEMDEEELLNPTSASVKKKGDNKKPGHALLEMADEGDEPDMTEEEMAAVMPKKKGMVAPMELEDEEEDAKMYARRRKNMHGDMPAMEGEEDEVEEDEVEEDEKMMYAMPKKKKGMGMAVPAMEDEEDVMEEDEEDTKMYARRRKGMEGAMPAMEGEEEDEELKEEEVEEELEEDEEVKMHGRRHVKGRRKGMEGAMPAMDGEEDEEEDEEEEDEEDEEYAEMGTKSFSPLHTEWEEIRRARIGSMGLKAADIGATGYVCAIERKAYGGSSPVCDDCPGGCVAEKGMPGILHVEGLAEKMFDGVVVDSGYSPDADMFVVDVQVKDGSVNEVFVDGSSAEILGFHKLDMTEFDKKSDIGSFRLIDFTEAAEIAVKSIDGTVVAIEPDIFEGFDSYAVEIEGFDGKSYDVFVALDGEVLGYDKYESDEIEGIEAEAAEIAMKNAFSEERRMDLAKDGMAMEDGSYPIVSEGDLRNAIQAFGRAKDKEATKKHIMKRARALKLESLIPANWIAGGEEKSSSNLSDAEFMASLVEFQLLEDSVDDN